MPTRPFQRFFGTLAGTMTLHVSLSNKTPTSICAALRIRVLIRLSFGVTPFKTQEECLNTMALCMFFSIGLAVSSLPLNTNNGSLATCGRWMAP